MIGAVIPTLDAAPDLAGALAALAPARAAGVVGDVVVADGGSRDGTAEVALRGGARVVAAPRGRGSQLAAGAEEVRGEFLLFLHADTRLAPSWENAARAFSVDPRNAERAAYFRFRLDDNVSAARRLERAVAWRCRVLGLPYGDQGLLIGRAFYRRLGGYAPMPLYEDVDIVRRIGRGRLVTLDADAITSAARWRRQGYMRRSARNLICLGLYFAGVSPQAIDRIYPVKRGHLVVFVKAPRLGAVKTRLGRDIGMGAAVWFYRRVTAETSRRLGRDRRWHLVLSVTPDCDLNARFWPPGIRRLRQGRGDLGRRMAAAIAALRPAPTLIIGSDIPGVTPSDIVRAFRLLAGADAVFGPARDGGYWLVGLGPRTAPRRVFANVRWSTKHALADTLKNLSGMRVAFATTRRDIDTMADLCAYLAQT